MSYDHSKPINFLSKFDMKFEGYSLFPPWIKDYFYSKHLSILLPLDLNFCHYERISKSLEFELKKILYFVLLNSNPNNSNIR